jgi:hypothetical protein
MTVVFNERNSTSGRKTQHQKKRPSGIFVEKIVDLQDRENDQAVRLLFICSAPRGSAWFPSRPFFTHMPGFRITLLEKDEGKCRGTVKIIAEKIVEYIESTKVH